MKNMERIFDFLTLAALIFLGYAVCQGLPLAMGPWTLKMKNFKLPFLILLFMFLAARVCAARRKKQGLGEFLTDLETRFAAPGLLPGLYFIFTVFFTWQQVTEYLALKINFIPFSFFDYMLYYYSHGKIHYTGLLHTWYHIDNLLLLLAPVWAVVRSPLLLIAIYGPLACLAIFPLYGIAREKLGKPALALAAAFLFLNYRYLQNLLQMNFCIEVLYPFFIFWAVYEAMKARWARYYLAVCLGLLLKEDAFLYFTGVAALTFFLHHGKKEAAAARIHAVLTVALGVCYYLFITRVFIPMTGNDILSENFHNFGDEISSEGEFLVSLFQHPLKLPAIFFDDPRKVHTYVRLFSRLAFLPLLSPSVLLVAVPVFPLFTHFTGRDTDFYELRFHYAAAVIPFVFIAFILGFANLRAWLSRKKESLAQGISWAFVLVLLVMNGGHFRTEAFTPEDIKSIRWAREVPAGNVVTHGHLLPYLGYREYNYYFAQPWEKETHPRHEAYVNADYYLVDKHVNPYPLTENEITERLTALEANPQYERVMSDGTRSLFKRKK